MNLNTADLNSKVCVVTGTVKSIGFGIAEQYAKHGANISLIDINPQVFKAANALCENGYTARSYVLDVTN